MQGSRKEDEHGGQIGLQARAVAPYAPERRRTTEQFYDGVGLESGFRLMAGSVQHLDEEDPGFEEFGVAGKAGLEHVHGFASAAQPGKQAGVGEEDAGIRVERKHFLIPQGLLGPGVPGKGRIHGYAFLHGLFSVVFPFQEPSCLFLSKR